MAKILEESELKQEQNENVWKALADYHNQIENLKKTQRATEKQLSIIKQIQVSVRNLNTSYFRYQGASARIGRKGRQPGYVPDKRGLNSNMHLAVDAHGLPVRMLVTDGTAADCKQAPDLIDGIEAGALLADRGYDSDAIVRNARKACMKAAIPPRKNRKKRRRYDKALYKKRHLVDNAFLALKRWRSIATCYAKNLKSFLVAVHARCIAIWLNIHDDTI